MGMERGVRMRGMRDSRWERMREIVRWVGELVRMVRVRREVWFRRDRRVVVCVGEAGLLEERRWAVQWFRRWV